MRIELRSPYVFQISQSLKFSLDGASTDRHRSKPPPSTPTCTAAPLAAEYGITHYPAPAGGCLLTDPGYALRIKELLRHQTRASRRDLELLRWGRHFRLPRGAKAVVGRTQGENEAISGLKAPGDYALKVENFPGPLVLVIGAVSEADLQEAAGLAAAYSDAPTGTAVQVGVEDGGAAGILRLEAPSKERFKDSLI